MRARLHRLDDLGNDKGPKSASPRRAGSELDPRTHVRGSNAGPLPWASRPEREALVDEATALFSRRYGRSFNREEAGQAMDRLVAFFALLHEWKQRRVGEGSDCGLAA